MQVLYHLNHYRQRKTNESGINYPWEIYACAANWTFAMLLVRHFVSDKKKQENYLNFFLLAGNQFKVAVDMRA